MSYDLEIERLVSHKHKLEAEIERLRAALKEITYDGPIWRAQGIAREALEQARKE